MKEIVCIAIMGLFLNSASATDNKSMELPPKDSAQNSSLKNKKFTNARISQLIKSTMTLMGPDAQAQEEISTKARIDISQSNQ